LKNTLMKIPDELWVMIMSYLSIEMLIGCQFVCKDWNRCATYKCLWIPFIWKLPREIRDCYSGLSFSKDDVWRGRHLKNVLAPHAYYAQVTFRGLEKEENLRKYATVHLLERWWDHEQWDLLYQTLSTLVYYDDFWGRPLEMRPSHLDDQDPDKTIQIFELEHVLSTCHSRIKERLEGHWLKKEWDLTRMWGNAFMVKANSEARRHVREPK